MIPTRRQVLLWTAPLLLGLLAVGVPSAWIPMVALDVVLLGLLAMDAAATRGQFKARRTVHDVQAVGRSFPVELHLWSDRPQELEIHDDAPGHSDAFPSSLTLQAGREGTVRYTTQVDRRGHHAFGPVTLRWSSPMGLWQRQQRIEVEDSVRVYPDFAQLRGSSVDARLVEQRVPARARRRPGGENEFQRLRPYVPGDPYRHIDWKATARRRTFVTREFGQESNQNVLILLDCGRMMSAESHGLTQFDHALNAALMLGQQALRHGDRVGLLAFDSQVRVWLPPKGGARNGVRLIRGTYDLFPSMEEPDYDQAFRYLSNRVRRRSLVVLLTAVADEVAASQAEILAGALAKRHVALSVWLRDTEVDGLLEAEGGDPYLRGAAAEMVGARERSLQRLAHRGVQVVDVAPEQLTAALLNRYLEVKARRLL